MTEINIRRIACQSSLHSQTMSPGNAIGYGRCAVALATLLAALLPMAGIRAQSPASQASLSGVIRDPGGAQVPEALVYLRNNAGGIVAIVQADDRGEYAFHGIPAGHYEVEVREHGFSPMRMRPVSIDAGRQDREDLALDVEDASDSMTVMGIGPRSSPAIQTEHVRIGSNVREATLVSKVEPGYPADAQASGVEGSVTVRAVISKDGNPLSVVSVDNRVDQRLARTAEEAVRRWHYEPMLLNGSPIEVPITISIAFRLKPEGQ